MSIANAAHCSMIGGGKALPYKRQFEWIASTGSQWFDTGFMATNGAIVEYSFIQVIPTIAGYIFGSHNTSNDPSNGYNRNQSGISSSTTCCFNKCDQFESFTVPMIDTSTFHTIKYDNRLYTRAGWFDGALVVNQTTTSVLSPINNIVAFYSQYNRRAVSGTIAWAKIWDINGVLVRDLIPVEDFSGTVCVYDKANDSFIFNSGTGVFAHGPAL